MADIRKPPAKDYLSVKRGVVVEWLERLGGESRLKIVSSRLGFAMRRLENCLCQPSSNSVPFSNQGRLRQRKERDGLRLSSAVSKIQWDSNHISSAFHQLCPRYSGTLTTRPTAPTTIRLWETFTFICYLLFAPLRCAW